MDTLHKSVTKCDACNGSFFVISCRISNYHIQLYVTCTVYHLLIGDAIGFLLIWDGCVTAYHRSHKQNSLNHEI